MLTKRTLLYISLFVSILAGCQNPKDFPIDHEQLSADEKIVLRFSHVVGENTPKGMAARKLATLVKEKSNDRIEIQIFSNGMLYKDGEEMQALLDDSIQIIAPATSKITKIAPEWSIFDLPFAFRNDEDISRYLASDSGIVLMDKLKQQNLHTVGFWGSGFKQISNNVRPIITPQDIANLRIRIMPSDILVKQFTTLGAKPKHIEFNTVFEQLQQGYVEGQENTLTNITSKNFHAFQQYLTISNHGYLGYVILMNENYWRKLPSDVQQILTETFEEVQQWEWAIANQLSKERLNEMKACQCITIDYLTDVQTAEWEKALLPVYDYYRKQFGDTLIDTLPKLTDKP